MKVKDTDQNEIFISAIKLGFFAITIAGLTIPRTITNQNNIFPHQAVLWGYLA